MIRCPISPMIREGKGGGGVYSKRKRLDIDVHLYNAKAYCNSYVYQGLLLRIKEAGWSISYPSDPR